MIFRPRKSLLVLWFMLSSSMVNANVTVTTDQLQLEFGGTGDLLSAKACIPDCSVVTARSVHLQSEHSVVRFNFSAPVAMELERFESSQRTHLRFFNAQSGDEINWRIPHSGWLLQLDTNQVSRVHLEPGAGFAGAPSSGFGQLLERVRYVSITEKVVSTTVPEEATVEPAETTGWFGIRNRFWTLMFKPDTAVRHAGHYEISSQQARMDFDSGNADSLHLRLYIGPVEPSALKSAAPMLQRLMYSGLWTPLRWICQLLFLLFAAIHQVIPSWSLAIMLLSLSVSILMRPLSRAAERLQEDVNEKQALLEPHLREIKKEFKGEQQAEKILALYKSQNIHPLYSLKSLAGVMIVVPVFIGAFDMLAENIWLSGESLLWIRDLSLPDSVATLPFSMPFLGDQLNVLPWLMTALSVSASWLHQPTGHDREMHRSRNFKLLLMALAFLILFYTFPAGMVLYWTTNNLISVTKALFQKHAGFRRTIGRQT